MKISVAMAVYNGTNYLNEQLSSLLSQTRVPDELVVVNDCSTDGTEQVLLDFQKISPFPVIILANETNQGSTISFDRAISACSGDIIFPSDHDDIWSPNKIRRLEDLFIDHPDVGLVFCDAMLIDADSNKIEGSLYNTKIKNEIYEAIKTNQMASRILQSNLIGGATSAFRADLRKYISPIPSIDLLLHDGWIGLIAAAHSKVMFIPEKLNSYRQHSEQQVGALGKENDLKFENRIEFNNWAVSLWERKRNDLEIVRERLCQMHRTSRHNCLTKKAVSAVEASIEQARKGLEHILVRRSLMKNFSRFPKIVKEYWNGNYSEYSNGIRSVARDILYR